MLGLKSRLLRCKAWPPSSATAESLDPAKPIEEEQSPFYDPAHFYPAKLGEVLSGRYQIATKLGHGARSTVWLARDLNQLKWLKDRYVAVKINATGTRENSSQHELDIHRHIAEANPRHKGWEFVRQLRDAFVLDGTSGYHVCLVFEPLREPLGAYRTRFKNSIIPPIYFRIMLHMILNALDYLHSECHLIHTDLNPNNIMVTLEDKLLLEIAAREEYEDPLPQKHLEDGRTIYLPRSNYGPPRRAAGLVEITDFGLAVSGNEKNDGVIQADMYRAPEVILEKGYSYSADIWSLGAMMWDCLAGKELFHEVDEGDDYNEERHLAYMTALLGPPPKNMVQSGKPSSQFYDADGNLQHPDLIPQNFNFEGTLSYIKGEEKQKFIDFARRMMKWDPNQRSLAKDMLDDPFLTMDVPSRADEIESNKKVSETN
ncbi:CMGC/SRPK protein kinase [Polytolypa hystricis UAMH7299]|uniref:non-specific serine/threonine protein kinase n=1 Tax=Polytolypa hystricis (strain UAMH7299) TaxID=1447883 RepID=A0A2B7Z4I0_POLH7|nr:CMGC/SRPK protein kinase [Polytolypa hystricis UAMH7299]